MIELSKKKLESLLKDVDEEVTKSQNEFNAMKKQLEELNEELVAKKSLKYSLETVLGMKG